jgi:hypothetical protein
MIKPVNNTCMAAFSRSVKRRKRKCESANALGKPGGREADRRGFFRAIADFVVGHLREAVLF